MYTVSSNYAEAVKSLARTWDLKLQVSTLAGEVLELDKSNITLGSFSFKEGATCADTVQVGSTFSNSIEFELINKNKQFNEYDFYGATVKPRVGLWIEAVKAFEYVDLGEFFVLENVKRFSTIPFSCFDRMSLANRVFDDSTIVYPTALVTLFTAAVQQCGATVDEALVAEVAALSLTINSLPAETVSCRDVFTGVGVLLAKNLRMDRSGKLEAFWYSVPTGAEAVTSPKTRTGNSEFDDNVVFVTGCYIADAYGNSFSVGTEDYAIELPSSPIIQGRDMSTMALRKTLAKLQQLVYRPAEVYTIGDPAIQAGDIVNHLNTSIGTVSLPVMTALYRFPGYGVLTTLGVPRSSLDQQSLTEKKFKQTSARFSKDRVELESKISQTAEQVLLKVSETYADWESFAQLNVEVDEIGSTVKANEENISQLIQQAGKVALTIKTAEGELHTTIDSTTWEALYRTISGDVASGFYFDFELGRFVFDGTGVFRNADGRTYIEVEGDEMVMYSQDKVTGEYVDKIHFGFVMGASPGSTGGIIEYPYLLLGNAGSMQVGMVKKFYNGLWVGNSAPKDLAGNFEGMQGASGFFIDTVNGKTYVVNGTNMKDVYAGTTDEVVMTSKNVLHNGVVLAEAMPIYLDQAEYDARAAAGSINLNTPYFIQKEV